MIELEVIQDKLERTVERVPTIVVFDAAFNGLQEGHHDSAVVPILRARADGILLITHVCDSGLDLGRIEKTEDRLRETGAIVKSSNAAAARLGRWPRGPVRAGAALCAGAQGH